MFLCDFHFFPPAEFANESNSSGKLWISNAQDSQRTLCEWKYQWNETQAFKETRIQRFNSRFRDSKINCHMQV